MTGFTPGPWEVSDGCDQYVCNAGQWIASTMGVRGAQGAANARLIAAAPDMFEAITAAMEWIEGGRIYEQQCCGGGSDCGCRGSTYADEAAHYLRAAIAKVFPTEEE